MDMVLTSNVLSSSNKGKQKADVTDVETPPSVSGSTPVTTPANHAYSSNICHVLIPTVNGEVGTFLATDFAQPSDTSADDTSSYTLPVTGHRFDMSIPCLDSSVGTASWPRYLHFNQGTISDDAHSFLPAATICDRQCSTIDGSFINLNTAQMDKDVVQLPPKIVTSTAGY